MANNKKTIKEMFNEVIALAEANGRDDIVEFAESRIAVLEKKSANKKPSATQEANEAFKSVIANVLNGSEGMTVSEIIKADEALSGLSNQKVTAVLRLMIADGTVDKKADKKKSLFFLKGVEA